MEDGSWQQQQQQLQRVRKDAVVVQRNGEAIQIHIRRQRAARAMYKLHLQSKRKTEWHIEKSYYADTDYVEDDGDGDQRE